MIKIGIRWKVVLGLLVNLLTEQTKQKFHRSTQNVFILSADKYNKTIVMYKHDMKYIIEIIN